MNAQSQLHCRLATETADGPVRLSLLPEAARFNLRIAPGDIVVASEAFGVELPQAIGERAYSGPRSALCLGPDEWVLHADEADRSAVEIAFASIYLRAPHSLTDISDREVAIEVSGDRAAEILSVGCPIDLDEIAPGSGTRTVFDSAQIVLHRDSADSFRIEIWRSFVPHVWTLLNTANAELATGL